MSSGRMKTSPRSAPAVPWPTRRPWPSSGTPTCLRNRYRRRHLPDDLRDEVIPKNILMIGPTGVGKTEIARRLAKLANAPFVKVEATKFTEVGYVGRDVDSMVRDLVQVAYQMLESERIAEVKDEAERRAVDRIVELLQAARRRGRR